MLLSFMEVLLGSLVLTQPLDKIFGSKSRSVWIGRWRRLHHRDPSLWRRLEDHGRIGAACRLDVHDIVVGRYLMSGV